MALKKTRAAIIGSIASENKCHAFAVSWANNTPPGQSKGKSKGNSKGNIIPYLTPLGYIDTLALDMNIDNGMKFDIPPPTNPTPCPPPPRLRTALAWGGVGGGISIFILISI